MVRIIIIICRPIITVEQSVHVYVLHSPNEKEKRSLCADSIGRTGSFDDVSKPMCNARGQLMTCIKEICNCHINNSSLLR